jgi:hypothetical protein
MASLPASPKIKHAPRKNKGFLQDHWQTRTYVTGGERENATLKKLEILAFGLAIIPLLASLWWTADSTKKTEALNPDRIWLLDAD